MPERVKREKLLSIPCSSRTQSHPAKLIGCLVMTDKRKTFIRQRMISQRKCANSWRINPLMDISHRSCKIQCSVVRDCTFLISRCWVETTGYFPHFPRVTFIGSFNWSLLETSLCTDPPANQFPTLP